MRGRDGKDRCAFKLIDFGFSTIYDASSTNKQRCGSIGYVAPEILNGDDYDMKVDVFSAGIIFYTLYCAGKRLDSWEPLPSLAEIKTKS